MSCMGGRRVIDILRALAARIDNTCPSLYRVSCIVYHTPSIEYQRRKKHRIGAPMHRSKISLDFDRGDSQVGVHDAERWSYHRFGWMDTWSDRHAELY